MFTIFFYGRGCFLFGVAIKIYNVRRLGFFVRAQPKLWFDQHRHVFIRSATRTLVHLGIKLDSLILIQKNASRRRRGKINDRGLKKKHHRMTPIEHFLLDIIQILFRDWIENTITDIGRCKAANDIFRLTLRNFFYKRWPIIIYYGRGCFFVRCCNKNYNVGRLGFFVRAQPK